MSRKKFWKLTWYDFGLWCLRIQELARLRTENFDLHRGIAGSLMAMYTNAHLSKGSEPYSASDFFVLSDDKQNIRRERSVDSNAWAESMKERFKRRGE